MVDYCKEVGIKHPLHNKTPAEKIAELEEKVKGMDKYFNILGTENTESKERIAKLENLHKGEL